MAKLRETVSDTFFSPPPDNPGSRFGLLALRKINTRANAFREFPRIMIAEQKKLDVRR
jgi:hypothetical protein